MGHFCVPAKHVGKRIERIVSLRNTKMRRFPFRRRRMIILSHFIFCLMLINMALLFGSCSWSVHFFGMSIFGICVIQSENVFGCGSRLFAVCCYRTPKMLLSPDDKEAYNLYAQPCETSNGQAKFSKADKDEYQI
jgi:hypothetical protein